MGLEWLGRVRGRLGIKAALHCIVRSISSLGVKFFFSFFSFLFLYFPHLLLTGFCG